MRLESVLAVCQLQPAQVNNLFQFILGYDERPPDTNQLGPGESLLLWIMDVLSQTRVVPESQWLFVASKLHPAVVKYAALCLQANQKNTPHELPNFNVAIIDRRFLAFDGELKMYDIYTSAVGAPEARPLETLCYDLAALFQRRYARCCELEVVDARTNAEPPQSPA